MNDFMNKEQRIEHLLINATKEIESLNKQIKTYRYAIKESNDWLIASEGIDLCYHMDSEPKDKQLVRELLDNINNEFKGGLK